MLSSDSVYGLFNQLTGFLWPILSGILVYASVLFYRADRRAHTVALVIGFSMQTLMGVWMQLGQFFFPFRFDQGDIEAYWMKALAIQTGVSLIGRGLVVYGLVTIALIQYRKSKAPRFEGDSDR